jgi:hypothetical protein
VTSDERKTLLGQAYGDAKRGAERADRLADLSDDDFREHAAFIARANGRSLDLARRDDRPGKLQADVANFMEDYFGIPGEESTEVARGAEDDPEDNRDVITNLIDVFEERDRDK